MAGWHPPQYTGYGGRAPRGAREQVVDGPSIGLNFGDPAALDPQRAAERHGARSLEFSSLGSKSCRNCKVETSLADQVCRVPT
jgi:hypothetical protein